MELRNAKGEILYKEIDTVDDRHKIHLLYSYADKCMYVMKILDSYNMQTYRIIKEEKPDRIPVIKDIIPRGDDVLVIEEYIRGKTIEEVLKERTFTEKETKKIINKLCTILEPLHKHRPMLVHRDIKASNLILTKNGDLYLIDFDAARIIKKEKSRDTTLIGTRGYAAPEQYGFGQSDQRTDIFSIGILMNKMLTGGFPSEKEYDGELKEIITKCTEMNPKRRYENVETLRKEILSGSHRVKKVIKELRKIPGYRSNKKTKEVTATVIYAMIFYTAFFTEDANDPENILSRISNGVFISASMVAVVFYLWNYKGWKNRFPFKQKSYKNRIVHMVIEVSRIALAIIIIIIAAGAASEIVSEAAEFIMKG